MLTVNEIKNKKFDKSAFGYKVEDVENFLNEVIDYVSALENEKAEVLKNENPPTNDRMAIGRVDKIRICSSRPALAGGVSVKNLLD